MLTFFAQIPARVFFFYVRHRTPGREQSKRMPSAHDCQPQQSSPDPFQCPLALRHPGIIRSDARCNILRCCPDLLTFVPRFGTIKHPYIYDTEHMWHRNCRASMPSTHPQTKVMWHDDLLLRRALNLTARPLAPRAGRGLTRPQHAQRRLCHRS